MIFPQHKQKKQNKLVLVFSIFALLALIFMSLKSKTVENFFVIIFSKINFTRITEVEKNGEASLYSARIKILENENKILKLESSGNNAEEINAEIKLGGGHLFSDILLLDAGKNSGIKKGDLVIAGGSIFVGKISETGEEWSKVLPIGRLGDKLGFRAGQDKEVFFEAVGTGRGELSAELPKDTPISIGDIVWIAEKPDFPAGLVINIKKSDGRDIQDITISSPLPLRSLVTVTIIRNQ